MSNSMPRLSVPAVLIALAISGCGGEPATQANASEQAEQADAGASPVASDPCALVTNDEVASATGEKIVNSKADGDICTYETDDAMASSVQVEIKRAGGAEQMEIARSAVGALGKMGADMKDAGGAEGDVGQAISETGAAPGIGDEAFFGPNQQLHVRKSDVYFAVTPPAMRSRMSGGSPLLSAEAKREMASAIAKRVLTKL